MTIRGMLPDDVGEVKALLDACFGSSAWSEQSILSELEKPDSYCTVAVKDGVIVGYLAFEQIADEGSIIEIAVRPDCRRQGIAKRLIERRIGLLRKGSAGSFGGTGEQHVRRSFV